MGRILSEITARLRRGRYGLHSDTRYAPFFIVGAPRSGTTLLRRILCANRDVHIPPETYMVGKAVRLWRKYQNVDWPDLVFLTLALFELHQDFGHFGVSLRPLAQRLKKVRGEERTLAFVLDAMYRYHGEETGRTVVRWGDKTPFHSYFMDEIAAAFPDVKFVHMLRDGADSVWSHVEGGIRPDMASAGESWVTSVRAVAAFADRRPGMVFEMRYEELVKDPVGRSRDLCAFLGLPFREEFVHDLSHADKMGDVSNLDHLKNVMKPVSTSSIGKGRARLSDGDKAVLRPVMDQELVARGYERL